MALPVMRFCNEFPFDDVLIPIYVFLLPQTGTLVLTLPDGDRHRMCRRVAEDGL